MKCLAFMKKELLEAKRSGRLVILGIVFILFGIMNPAIAKLTPFIVELLSDQLAEAGMTVGEVAVDAAVSWVQFYKNIPVALIIYILAVSGSFTKEYESGTLVLLLTKGLKRRWVIESKAAVLILGWTAGYFLSFGITYGYNEYFWDNSVMENLAHGVIGWWIFGVFAVALVVFFSAVSRSTSSVMIGCVGGIAVSYIIALVPKLAPYTPTSLTAVSGEITKAPVVTIILIAALLAASIPIFNKREL